MRTGIQAADRTDSHGHLSQNGLTCADQQAELCPPSASSRGGRAPSARRATTGGGYQPADTAPALSPGSRYPQTASRWRTGVTGQASTTATCRPAGDPDRPAMYPGGPWHPPPVDLRRHRASPNDHADAPDSANVRTCLPRQVGTMGACRTGASAVVADDAPPPPVIGDDHSRWCCVASEDRYAGDASPRMRMRPCWWPPRPRRSSRQSPCERPPMPNCPGPDVRVALRRDPERVNRNGRTTAVGNVR